MSLTMRVLLALGLLLAAAAQADEPGQPPYKPMLRIETGMHTENIMQVATDAKGRYLVTGSPDRTVRIWDSKSSTLLRTLRPPIGRGGVGAIFTVAMSPDGKLVAASGLTGTFDKKTFHSVYLFDRLSGAIVRRLEAFPGDVTPRVQRMLFSRDGKRLLISFGDLLLYDVETGALVRENHRCPGTHAAMDTDGKGRFVTVSLRMRSEICLLDPELNVLVQTRRPLAWNTPIFLRHAPQGGEHVSRVSFSPDGEKIAVAYSDAAQIDVLEANSLTLLYRPETADIARADLGAVAWSADGRLYAAGSFRKGDDFMVRVYEGGGLGGYKDVPAAPHRILDLLALPQGGVAFAGRGPHLGVLSAKGERELRTGSLADLGRPGAQLLLSEDGQEVEITTAGRALRFSPRLHRLTPASPSDPPLHPPALSAPRAQYAGVPGTEETLRCNNQHCRVAEDFRESPWRTWYLSLAIGPRDDGLSQMHGVPFYHTVFGGDQYLIFYPAGKLPEIKEVHSDVAAVNFSRDGKLIVAAHLNGTLHWYRVTDRQELLRLFIDRDGKRWVAFTPSGYYDTSVGGEDLLRWHVNRDRDHAADVFPAAHFRRRFYRRDVIERLLAARDEERAFYEANQAAGRSDQAAPFWLPPVVTVLSPQDGTAFAERDATVRVALRVPPGDQVDSLQVVVNGEKALLTRGAPEARTEAGEQIYSLKVPLPQQDCLLTVLADTAHATGESQPLSLRYAGPPVAPGALAVKGAQGAGPKLKVLAVGVSPSGGGFPQLTYPAKDASDVARSLAAQKGKLFDDVQVQVLTGPQATRERIRAGLGWLRQGRRQDMAVLFLAGHGLSDSRSGGYYFVPHDGDQRNLAGTLLADIEIQSTLSQITGKVLLLLDTCHAGGVLSANPTRFMHELSSAKNGVVVLAASAPGQTAKESAAWQNGAFTKAVMEALSGKADFNKSGTVTFAKLHTYVSERVKELTNGVQTPTIAVPSTVPDFALARWK